MADSEQNSAHAEWQNPDIPTLDATSVVSQHIPTIQKLPKFAKIVAICGITA